MNYKILKVLAVADPAVLGYTDEKLNIMSGFSREVKFDIVPWRKYYAAMTDVFEGKSDYDVVMIAGHLWKRDFVENGWIVPIEFEEEDVLPAIVNEMKYKGNTYLSPSFCDGHMIVYRKSMTGKRLESVVTPQEYSEFAQSCAIFENFPIAMKAHPSEIFTDAIPFMRMNGDDIYDEISHKATCGSKGIINGLEAYCRLKKYALHNTDTFGNEQISDALWNKKAAAAVTWSGQLGIVFNEKCIEPDDLCFSTFSTGWNVTWSFAITASSENQAEANELLRYLRSPEIDLASGAFSGAPVRMNSYLIGKEKYPWYKCQLKMIENAKPLPDMKSSGDKNGVLYEEITNAFSGKKTAAGAMSDAQKKINSI